MSLATIFYKYFRIVLGGCLFILATTHTGYSQAERNYQSYFKKGDKLTTFSIEYTGAEKDESGNQEFEKSFKRFKYEVNSLYLVTDNIGVGPLVSYQWLSRELLVNDNPPQTDDFITSNFEYGLTSAYFLSLARDSERSPSLYLGGGVSWLRSKFERKSDPGDTDYRTNFGYILYTGLYIPIGDKIGINWRLQRTARKQEYLMGNVVNGTVVITDRQTKWPSTTSLSVGFTVKF